MGWILEQGFRDLERGIERLGETVERLIGLRVFYGEDEGSNPLSLSKSPSQSSAPTAKEASNPACSLCGSRADRLVLDRDRGWYFCFPCLERFKERS